MTTKLDAIVIGTGQAGPALAGRLNQEGLKTVIIERKLVGGTCVNVGCIPTKTLVGSAKVAYSARQAEQFGVIIDGSVTVDMQRVKERKDAIAGASNKGVTDWLESMEHVSLVRGHARFIGPRQIEVNGDTFEADKIFIDVGARARVPNIEGLDQVDYLTNSSMMELDTLPPT
jgi:pyruvate/2-oxoglutarate dehydrogenase complex dihydrolipoamide dehydrogenase (E3) component